MIDELRIHGVIGQTEFYTNIGGSDVSKTIFYEETPTYVRFFTRGNEFMITEDEIRYKGCGGSFCEYMFGVDKPMDDTAKRDVINRLIMFGAYMNENEKVVFTDNVEGAENFYRLLLQGNAVQNYYFLISSDYKGSYRKRQQLIVKAVGKFLKRTSLVSELDDVELMRAFMESLEEKNATVFIIKLIHKGNNMLYSYYRDFYTEDRILDANKEMFLEEVIEK
ncbi:MAG: TIGR04442 family protein, partial [Thermodesulfovibrionales bacterium]